MKADFTSSRIPLAEVSETSSISDIEMSIMAQYQQRSLNAAKEINSSLSNAIRINKTAEMEFSGVVEARKKMDIDPSEFRVSTRRPNI